ncbi:MAG: hypothetical protein Q9160_001574 [Pyrenula sp. 1 TL-2023]
MEDEEQHQKSSKKAQVVDQQPKVLKALRFGVLSHQDVLNQSVMEVSDRNLFDQWDKTKIVPNGGLDPRMGVTKKNESCPTCNETMKDCNGHFGYVQLTLPLFHVGYFKKTISILQQICKECSSVLLSEGERQRFLKQFRAPNIDSLRRVQLTKKVAETCKKTKVCPQCAEVNGQVRKAGTSSLKIFHDKFKAYNSSTSKKKMPPPSKIEFDKSFANAVNARPEIEHQLRYAMDDLNPLRVLRLFRRVSNVDCELFGMRPEETRPEGLLWQYLPAAPNAIRPTQGDGSGVIIDDVTAQLTNIVAYNNRLKEGLMKGVPIENLMSMWDYLSLQVAIYINSEIPGLQKGEGGKVSRSLVQRLKGKGGRFRGNLSGKRVDYSGRTVISPDPNLNIDEVAIPFKAAKTLTYPEMVNAYNLKDLQDRVRNGARKWPGATWVYKMKGSVSVTKRFLKFGNRENIAAELQIGDIVHRHLKDRDIVLFNRQPSLHKLSIMSHFVRVRPYRTFRLNECVCTPYNADFDGDEMNLHVPQTEEARTEAMLLMGVKNNIVTPKNGEPIISAIQDFVTAAFLMSSLDVFYDRKTFINICIGMLEEKTPFDLPAPSIIKPQMLWSGKQIFNVLMRPYKKSPVLVNLDAECRGFRDQDWPWLKAMCAPQAATKKELETKSKHPSNKDRQDDNHLCIRNSEIMCGRMDKATIGAGKKNSVFYVIYRDFGPDAAASAMNRLSRMSARWLTLQGFSVGVSDVTPTTNLRQVKSRLIEKAFSECNVSKQNYRTHTLKRKAGLDEAGTLEAEQVQSLNTVRSDIAKALINETSVHNAPMVMATSGSKGSNVNVAQMMALLGQQDIEGKRVMDGFQDRTLPHFVKHVRSPPSKGFVRNSFFTGLNPYEFLFHAVGGRVGLVDTAVKTAETGYMSRRLMKSLEDLATKYDDTVRTSTSSIIQFQYGDDKLDPVDMEASAAPVNFDRTFAHVSSISFDEADKGLLPQEVLDLSQKILIQYREKVPRLDHEGKQLPWSIFGTKDEDCIDHLESARGFYDEIGDFLLRKAEAADMIRKEKKALSIVQWSTTHESTSTTNGSLQSNPRGSARRKAAESTIQSARQTSTRGKRKSVADDTQALAESSKKRRKSSRNSAVASSSEQSNAGQPRSGETTRHVPPSTENRFDLTSKISQKTVKSFIALCLEKYRRAQVEPGHAVGAVGAQSIGEPGTQMTLKTFHFAGIAGMSLTSGVPRIKEIINASKEISTPVITCTLMRNKETGEISERFARIVKGRIESLYLGEIATLISLYWEPNSTWRLTIRLASKTIQDLGLDLTPEQVRRAIEKHRGLQKTDLRIECGGSAKDKIHIFFDRGFPKTKAAIKKSDDASVKDAYLRSQQLKRILPEVNVLGHPQATRVVVNAEDDPESGNIIPRKKRYEEALLKASAKKHAKHTGERPQGQEVKTKSTSTSKAKSKSTIKDEPTTSTAEPTTPSSSSSSPPSPTTLKQHKLLVEGYGLRYCMNTDGVNPYHTTTNSVIETLSVLGIEAARQTIITELAAVMKDLSVDPRHLALLADVMTYRGEVLGITRFGLAKMRDDSTLQLASFEKTADHVFDAGIAGSMDRLDGVSESVIVGKTMGIGTGGVDVVRSLGWEGKMFERGSTIFGDFWEEKMKRSGKGRGKGKQRADR